MNVKACLEAVGARVGPGVSLADHDGVSQLSELQPLVAYGVAGIDLSYVTSRRRDRHGNQMRWTSRVYFAEGGSRLAASDVFFVLAD